MIRQSRPDVMDLIPRARSRSRSLSMSSDITAASAAGGAGNMVPPASPAHFTGMVPEAAYIAASAATQIVTSDHESFFQTLSAERIVKPGPPTILVTTDALRLVNQFLDYLLWSILLVGKSTALKSLRPAVTEVLKSRLAREAIASAEAELEEYLGDADEEELEQGLPDADEFDIERIWKKARLRCMIYSSLGDLEEDDEDDYEESEYSSNGLDQYGRNGSSAGVTPAVAIFLTSILEFIGEQTLLVAGHATVARFSQARIAAAAEDGDGEYEPVDRPSVEELDMEKVALNPVLGRMWRQWKKLLRGPTVSGQIVSRAPSTRRDSRRQSTISTVSIQSVLESKSDTPGSVSPNPPSRKSDDGTTSPAEEPQQIPPNVKSGLRKLASSELLGNAPLTPIPETPGHSDSSKMPMPDMEAMKHEIISGIPDFPRPASMTTLPSHHPLAFVFPFTTAPPKERKSVCVKQEQEEEEKPVERAPIRRARSNSLPLPGAFPFSADDIDFPLSPLAPLSPMSLINMPVKHEDDEDDIATPVPEKPPQFPEHNVPQETDLESIAELDETGTDMDDEAGETSTIDSFVIHETAEATATTPTFYRAQSVRIISTGSAPIGFTITDRGSSSTISTVRDKSIPEEQQATEAETRDRREEMDHSAEEIGIARTSDVSIPPTALPTPVQSPIATENAVVQVEESALARRSSIESSGESSGSAAAKDIAKQRRRRSKYYIPVSAPSAPDFYPEHHTQEEIAEHLKIRDNAPKSRISQILHIQTDNTTPSSSTQAARKSAREELLDLYSHDPEYEEEEEEPEPVKRQTKPARSLRGVSPFGSPDLSQPAPSTHSDSSESLAGRSHSSSALSADRRQYPSFDMPRPASNRDASTPTSNQDRAGVRVWTPPATPDTAKGGRFKATLNKKGHGQSNSISSQTSVKIKNLISGGRPTTADEKRQGGRNDWDNESAYSDTHASKIDEKERSFEQLINSGTTLQYTLTPDNVKRIDLEIASSNSRKGSGDSGRGAKGSGDKYVVVPSAATASITQSQQLGRSNSQRTRPLTTIASEEYEDTVPDIPSRSARSPRSPPRTANSDNIKFFPPRSTSTGSGSMSHPPQRGASLHPINTSGRPSGPVTVGQAPLSPQSPKSAIVNGATKSPLIPRRPTAGSLDEVRPLRSVNSKTKLVARAPQPATADSTLALIDFFRNTPPPPVEGPAAQVPTLGRTPYKSVMDPKYNAAQDSMSSIAEKSATSSYNSQADLIKKPEAPLSSPRIPQRPQTDHGPPRRQVRVRDPYAIDSDSEEEDFDDEDEELFGRRPNRGPPKQEESLAEFLMNAPPPPESPAPSQKSFPSQPLKKKSSAAQLIGRFRSSSKSTKKITKSNVSAPLEARSQPANKYGAVNGSSTSIPARKHMPLPVKDDGFQPRAQSSGGPSNYGISSASSGYHPMPMPAVRKPVFQPRDAKTYNADSDSSGLADFLRYTGPPVTLEPAAPVSGEKFKGGNGGKKKRGIAV
ncbi:hypothetical protein TWF694_003720 [Orbilia ellipsospora]|uniref:Uncharacterized protein n=1 Tax=Orbilia ellipsospora TaxID=2528407 RepID=A0AAV9WZ22_9PEZI